MDLHKKLNWRVAYSSSQDHLWQHGLSALQFSVQTYPAVIFTVAGTQAEPPVTCEIHENFFWF
jgi:hypothetical protein